jgi:hypothetical protein
MAPCVPYFVSLDLTDECCRIVDAVMYSVQNNAGWWDVCNLFFSAYGKANPGKANTHKGIKGEDEAEGEDEKNKE